MTFYNNQIPYENHEIIEKDEYRLAKEPNTILQFLLLLALSFLLLSLTNYVFKPIFGFPVRRNYSFVEYTVWQLVVAFVFIVIIRPLVKSLLLPEGPLSGKMAFYYKLPIPSFQVNYQGPLTRGRIIVVSVLLFLIISFISLCLMKIGGFFFYTFEITMYLNAVISSYGFYNIIVVLLNKNFESFVEHGMTLYVK